MAIQTKTILTSAFTTIPLQIPQKSHHEQVLDEFHEWYHQCKKYEILKDGLIIGYKYIFPEQTQYIFFNE